jgi:hypothetical protein
MKANRRSSHSGTLKGCAGKQDRHGTAKPFVMPCLRVIIAIGNDERK